MDNEYKKLIQTALKEDLEPKGDITSDCTIDRELSSEFQLTVNEDTVLAGLDVFKEVFYLLDPNISIKTKYENSSEIKKGNVVSSVTGNTLSILKGERTALNFLSHLSGIATNTKKLVALIKDTNVTLLDTRKTTPILRCFERQAILAGGAKNHRFNLSDMLLIKDNHIANAGGVSNALIKAKEKYPDRSSNGKNLKIEIEVKNLNELKEAISCKPDIIMLDNWEINDLKAAVKLVPKEIFTEASGEINPENIFDYAKTGVNYISTSYMVKNAKWIDFSLNAI